MTGSLSKRTTIPSTGTFVYLIRYTAGTFVYCVQVKSDIFCTRVLLCTSNGTQKMYETLTKLLYDPRTQKYPYFCVPDRSYEDMRT